jgi:long-chain fatty acid transport protein
MQTPFRSLSALGLLAYSLSSIGQLHATDGYFDYGYGTQAKGIGGAGVAFPQDSIAPATNPAGISFIEDRTDLGLTYFRPERSSKSGTNTFDGNGTKDFYIPELGYRHGISDDLAFGVAVYGNGGMNTDYGKNPGFGTGHAGVDLSQLFITPTLAYKFAEGQSSIGFSPIIAYQRFKAYGLQNFGIANEDYDNSFGAGGRIGYTGKITDWLTIGATYQSRISATKFDKYDHLFAEQGSFDIPENYAAGLALKPTEKITIAFDFERINYSDIKSVGNFLNADTLGSGLGSDGGPGFGWRDVNVIKTGIAYDVTDHLTLRAGYNYSTQPIRKSQTTFNVLAPGIIQHHATLGATYRFNQSWELTGFYAHGFQNTLHGDGSSSGAADLTMSQDTFGLAVGWTL